MLEQGPASSCAGQTRGPAPAHSNTRPTESTGHITSALWGALRAHHGKATGSEGPAPQHRTQQPGLAPRALCHPPGPLLGQADGHSRLPSLDGWVLTGDSPEEVQLLARPSHYKHRQRASGNSSPLSLGSSWEQDTAGNTGPEDTPGSSPSSHLPKFYPGQSKGSAATTGEA